VHVTPPVKMMIVELAKHLSFPAGMLLEGLTKPAVCDTILKLLGDKGKFFDPILHNTVNATIVKGGNKINVIPSKITLELDGRILPGYKIDDMVSELKSLIGNLGEIEVTSFDPGPSSVDLGMFNTLAEILKEADDDGIPIPFVVSGVTDARFFAKLGIQTYGFTPMLLPKDMDFSKLIHSADERIPVDAVEFGVNAIFKLLQSL
jgi:acetylornithine deacetylase/succinyl-diaminopimelate desuccinylase-like protein